MEKDVASGEKALDHAWRYFALHAQQRISVFYFFVVLSGILATAIGGGLQAGKAMSPLVSMLGGLLVLIAFVFWKLDRRGSQLVKLSEAALRACEVACMPEHARIFVQEEGPRPSIPGADPVDGRSAWTFGTSFRLIFLVMGGVGALASLVSVFRWLTDVATRAG